VNNDLALTKIFQTSTDSARSNDPVILHVMHLVQEMEARLTHDEILTSYDVSFVRDILILWGMILGSIRTAGRIAQPIPELCPDPGEWALALGIDLNEIARRVTAAERRER
jgi:hypothetical protein